MTDTLKETWSELKNRKINIRNSYASGNKEEAVAHIRAAVAALQRMEQVMLNGNGNG